jgi:heme-degrading monooxygenase HmoA
MLYDSVIKEMGRAEGSLPSGEIYHLAAHTTGGGLIADIWESRETFDAYAKSALIPLTAKRGLFSPEVEFCDVLSMKGGEAAFTRGIVTISHLYGNLEDLLSKSEGLETKLAVPEGLLFAWCAKRADGICYTAHWRSRDDAEAFINGAFQEALRSAGMPRAQIESYDVYNTMDSRRVHAEAQ